MTTLTLTGEHRGPLVVPSLGVIQGGGPGTVIYAPDDLTGAVIESADFESLTKVGTAQWRNQGAVVQPTLRQFTVDGKGKLTDRPDINAADKAKEVRYGGIRLFSSGAVIQNVGICDVPGTALLTSRGTSPRSGVRDIHDAEEMRVEYVRIIAALMGWVIDGAHSDGTSHGVAIGGIRGDGFTCGKDAGGWLHTGMHVYCADRGIVEHGCNAYVGSQGENCRIGLYSDGEGSTWIGHKSFGNRECGVVLAARGRMEAASLKATEGLAYKIESTCHGSYIDGDVMLGAKADGTKADGGAVNGDKTTLRVKCWGGKTQLVIGNERPVSGCNIDIECDGAECGVDVKQLGTGNTIRVRANAARVGEAIKLPAKRDGSNLIEVVKVK